MNNSDIFTEVDSIMSEGKFAIEDNLFSYIRLKTNMQLHGYKVYEDSKYNAWRIFDESGNVMSFPFGFIAVDIFNQLNSLKSEDAFLNYEKRIRTGAPKNESTNATFDKPCIFQLFNHGSSGDKIGEYKRQDSIETYNKFSILYGYIQSELYPLALILLK